MGVTPLLTELRVFEVGGAAISPILAVLLFNIVLPTVDIVTDLIFIWKLYSIQSPLMANGLLTAFLLNYIFCLVAFIRKSSKRTFSSKFEFKYFSVSEIFIAGLCALLNLFPQFGKS